MRRFPLGLVAGLALTCVATSAVAVQAPTSEVLCRTSDERLVEISGLVRSVQHPDVVWVHNDSSDAARIYGIDLGTCDVVAEVELRGVRARDIESIASGKDARGRPVLWIADIGDNRDSWPDVGLYRIREPKTLGSKSRKVREYRFTYADRPHNAETLVTDGDRLLVATWQLASGGLHELSKIRTRGVSTAERIGDVGSLITDGAVAPDGSGYVLRDYLDVHFFEGAPPGRKLATLPLPAQPQGEAIDWTADGRSLIIASEDDNRIMQVDVPWWILAGMNPPDHLVS